MTDREVSEFEPREHTFYGRVSTVAKRYRQGNRLISEVSDHWELTTFDSYGLPKDNGGPVSASVVVGSMRRAGIKSARSDGEKVVISSGDAKIFADRDRFPRLKVD